MRSTDQEGVSAPVRRRPAHVLIRLILVAATLATAVPVAAQVASPLQSGHYTPVMMNVRDLVHPPPGLFLVWYNTFTSSSSFIDRDGNEFSSIDLSDLNPALPDVSVDLGLDAYAAAPTVFWASPFRVLGGARYLAGIAPSYVSAEVSVVTERAGLADPDTSIVRRQGDRVSGFSDLFVTPLGLSWSWEKCDLTAMYSFYAPTGKYETGDPESVGLGFWTHQLLARGYYYPRPDRATALMLGLVQEFNGKIDGVDVTPGDRFTLEWGLSQYFSERFEVAVQGAHNWQVTDDAGGDVYWDPGYHDRKSTLGVGATYWAWPQKLAVTGKYAFDFGVRQRFENDTFFVNVLFVPGWLTGAPTRPHSSLGYRAPTPETIELPSLAVGM
jgi:hypothetical protein